MSPNGHSTRKSIVLRLSGIGETHQGDFDSIAGDYRGLADIVSQAAEPPRRLIQSLSPADILGLEAEVARSVYAPVRSLVSYWRILYDAEDATFLTLLANLRLVPGVTAYEEEPVRPGAYTPAVASLEEQTYLEERPDGVNARWAWDQGFFAAPVVLPAGVPGKGLRVGVLDQDWNEGHPELGNKASLVHGERTGDPTDVRHGTSVLGILFAGHGAGDVAGIAPGVDRAYLVTPFLPGGLFSNADAIVAGTLKHLQPGDVFLIELEGGSSHTPLEREAANFDAIRLATALGRVVVELAGNGTKDLGTVELKGFDADGTIGWNEADQGGEWDSGAIVVGAHDEVILPGDARQRLLSSNYGDRIDCFAQGSGVWTTDSMFAAPRQDFGGTSSASAIIAGTVLLIQDMWATAHNDGRLSAWQIRSIVRDAGSGAVVGVSTANEPTPVHGLPGDVAQLKYVPNLAWCAERLTIMPDLHVRDYLGDDGQVPTEGILCRSPDIIVTQDAQGDFGEGSGTEDQDDLGDTAVEGQDNWVYVRARNLGSATAEAATARVWWSEPATLITPEDWNLIGAAPFPPVEGNASQLAVAGPLKWDSVPVSGHYCFVTVADCPADLAPPLPAPEDWEQFTEFIRANNSVAWRNFNVIDQPQQAGVFSAQFLIRGAPDERRPFTIRVEQRLPAGAVVEVEAPVGLARKLRGSPLVEAWRLVDATKVKLRLSRLPQSVLAELRLAARARYQIKVTVSGLAGGAGGSLTFQQLYGGRAVGQLTYRFRSGPRRQLMSKPSIQQRRSDERV